MEHPRHQYPLETAALQALAESCGLTEQIKWGKPCYTLDGGNIVLIQRFNAYIALLFFKGALLKDPEHRLHRIGQHMETPRQLRFTSLAEITRQSPLIKAYIEQAIDLQTSGEKPPPKQPAEYPLPDELKTKLEENAALRTAFAALTPGRQKGYIFQIGSAKQSATRAARVEKYTPLILAGKGLND